MPCDADFTDTDWLVIFDNIEDTILVRVYLPISPHRSYLILTQYDYISIDPITAIYLSIS